MACAREGFTRRRLALRLTAGLLAGLPILFGLPLARVEESDARPAAMRSAVHGLLGRGAGRGRGGSAARVTSLRPQLVAMSNASKAPMRPQGTSSPPTTSMRCCDPDRRASGRCRARAEPHPRCARTDPAAELQSTARGSTERRAEQLATATLRRQPASATRFSVVDVASARRQIRAADRPYPGAVEFFPAGHELSSLRQAGPAVRLSWRSSSHRRHEQVTRCSRSLTPGWRPRRVPAREVAERLVAVVPRGGRLHRGCLLWTTWNRTSDRRECRGLRTSMRLPRELVISVEDTPYCVR